LATKGDNRVHDKDKYYEDLAKKKAIQELGPQDPVGGRQKGNVGKKRANKNNAKETTLDYTYSTNN
jgi:hypothetical protein